jgi:3-demethoxyubiquinol 3-hydroxylase
MDALILAIDRAARTLSGAVDAKRRNPAESGSLRASSASRADVAAPAGLTDAERAESIALMRVNHAGEVAAQALYQGQALFSRDAALRDKLGVAANEELDHLAWTRERVAQLGGRTSVFDPLWYAGSFAIGAAAAALGDKMSLSFLQATEEQVEAHLDSHLSRLPAADVASRKIVTAMKADEAQHAQTARKLGAQTLSMPAQGIMRAAAKVMTTLSAKL